MSIKTVTRLIVALVIFWWLLSGMFTPLLLTLGMISVCFVCYFAWHMQVLEHHGQAIYRLPFQLLRYWCWLAIEILIANWNVSKRILHPSLPIKPVFKTIPAQQNTALGRVIYANSITLTPGTVAITIDDDNGMLVHALHEEDMHALVEGMMATRVCQIESSLPTTPINNP